MLGLHCLHLLPFPNKDLTHDVNPLLEARAIRTKRQIKFIFEKSSLVNVMKIKCKVTGLQSSRVSLSNPHSVVWRIQIPLIQTVMQSCAALLKRS